MFRKIQVLLFIVFSVFCYGAQGNAAHVMSPPPPDLEITTESLPDGMEGAAYSATLAAAGGTTPYTWSIQTGSLPDGLSLEAATGVISGTPSVVDTFTFTIQVNDDASGVVTKELSIIINAESPVLDITEGTVGTEFTITGSGFGLKKPKVFLLYLKNEKPKKHKCKIIEHSDTSIKCRINNKKITPGLCDVKIKPKGSNNPPIILEEAFTIMEPWIVDISPETGIVKTKTEVTIEGYFFGTKKPKVFLGYEKKPGKYKKKKCKIRSWSMEPSAGESTVVFVVPKKLRAGVYDVIIKNKIGSHTVESGFEITE